MQTCVKTYDYLLLMNLEKLNRIASLEDGWDLYKATSFSNSLIEFCRNLLFKLNRQPEIFPTANNSIQFEFKNKDDYLEIEIYDDLSHIEYYMKKNGDEIEKSVLTQGLIKIVDEFYQ